MINLRRRMAAPRSTRMLLPALIFFGFATLSSVGAGTVAALCLVPAALVFDATRAANDGDESDREQKEL